MTELSNLPPGVTDDMIPGDTPADRALQDEHDSVSYEQFREAIKTRYGYYALHDDLLFSEYQCGGRTCAEFIEWLALDKLTSAIWAEVQR